MKLRADADAQRTKLHAEAEAAAIRLRAAAEAEATRITGEAEADATKARGLAEAEATRARMEAEAAGIQKRAAALSQNQDAVIAQQIAEQLPDIVRAAASPFEHVGQFTVLNGARGVTEALAEIIQQAGSLTNMARQTLLPGSVRTATDGEPTPRAQD
jgi:flotillin